MASSDFEITPEEFERRMAEGQPAVIVFDFIAGRSYHAVHDWTTGITAGHCANSWCSLGPGHNGECSL